MEVCIFLAMAFAMPVMGVSVCVGVAGCEGETAAGAGEGACSVLFAGVSTPRGSPIVGAFAPAGSLAPSPPKTLAHWGGTCDLSDLYFR